MSIENKSSEKSEKILALDYGKSKVGLAWADGETKIAFAWKTLENNKDFFQNLAEAIEKENIKKIIIGIPTHVNIKKKEYEVKEIGKRILELMPLLEVEYQDEMFTTKIAQANLIQKGVKRIKKYDDQEAARIILQAWLDTNRKI